MMQFIAQSKQDKQWAQPHAQDTIKQHFQAEIIKIQVYTLDMSGLVDS